MVGSAKTDNKFGPRKPRKQIIGSLIGCVVFLVLGGLSLEVVMPSVNFDGANHSDVPSAITGAVIAAVFFWQAFRFLRRAIRG
jgi:TRAP-type C4-dicarboxylate transport system permease small subunit